MLQIQYSSWSQEKLNTLLRYLKFLAAYWEMQKPAIVGPIALQSMATYPAQGPQYGNCY